MFCAYCGKPMIVAVQVGASFYHEECCHGQGWKPPMYEPLPKNFGADCAPIMPLTETDIRRIVREEVATAIEPILPIKWVGGPR